MSDFFSQLSPQSVIILGVAWLVREVLGFVKKMMEPLIERMKNGKNGRNGNAQEIILLKSIVKGLADNNDTLIKLLTEIKLQTQKIQYIENSIKSP